MMLEILAFVLISESLNTTGQIFFKKAANLLEHAHFKTPSAYFRFLREVFTLKSVWLGFLSMALGLVAWLMALTQGDVSFVYPVGSLQYVLVIIAAKVFLREKIDGSKLFGTLLIIAGITCIALGR